MGRFNSSKKKPLTSSGTMESSSKEQLGRNHGSAKPSVEGSPRDLIGRVQGKQQEVENPSKRQKTEPARTKVEGASKSPRLKREGSRRKTKVIKG